MIESDRQPERRTDRRAYHETFMHRAVKSKGSQWPRHCPSVVLL